MSEGNEEADHLLAVARQTTQSIFLARQRAEQELLRTKAELEERTLALTAALELAQATLAERDRARAEMDEARRAALAANDAKTRFLHTISHEVRTPLGAIGGYAQLMEDGINGELSDGHREFVVRIRQNQSHILRLVNELLDLAKVESGSMELKAVPVTLATTVNDVRPMIEPQLLACGLRMDVEGLDSAAVVRADPPRVQQIVLNLLSNAVKFSSHGACVTISTTMDCERVQLLVRDEGVGIAPDKFEAVFQPFVQADPTTSAARGTGLGLSISRHLARAMGGDLTVESVLGQGSTFVLGLPRVIA